MHIPLAFLIVLIVFIIYYVAVLALPEGLVLLIFGLRVSWSKFAKIIGIELVFVGIGLAVFALVNKMRIAGGLGSLLGLLFLAADVFIWVKLLKRYVPDRYGVGKAVGAYITRCIIALVIAPIAAVFIVASVVQSFSIDGNSMFPALRANEKVLVYKFEKGPSDNAVIVYKLDAGNDVLGRVHGTPGQTVSVSQGQVDVGGHTRNVESYALGADQYYVTVDNAFNNSPPRIISSSSIVGTIGPEF